MMILVLEILLAIGFAAARLQLNLPLQPLSLLEVLLLGAFAAVLTISWLQLGRKRPSINDGMQLLFVTGLFFIGLASTLPTSKTIQQAREFTEQRSKAVTTGYTLGVSESEKTVPYNQATRKLQKEIPAEHLDSALRALNESLVNPEATLEQVQQQLNPKVPTRYDEWSCSEFGCSYADQERIWTISRSDIYLSAGFSLLSLLALIWIVRTSKADSNG